MALEKFNPQQNSEWQMPNQPEPAEAELRRAEAEIFNALNQLDSLTKLNGDPQARAMAGSRAMQAVVNYFDVSPNKAQAYADLEAKLKQKYSYSYIHVDEILYGAAAEFQIQSLATKVAENINPSFRYRHADEEADIAGVDAFIAPPLDSEEFINSRTGKPMELALSIKAVPLPAEINDIFYPCRTQAEFDEGLQRIISDYKSLQTDLSRKSIEDNIDRITKQMTTAYRRLHGYEWDDIEGEWFKPKSVITPLQDRSHFIPVIALASSQSFAPIGNYEEGNYFTPDLTYTAEYQLGDNPDKWSRKFYTSDGYLDPALPFAA